jgi:hypothetical protein
MISPLMLKVNGPHGMPQFEFVSIFPAWQAGRDRVNVCSCRWSWFPGWLGFVAAFYLFLQFGCPCDETCSVLNQLDCGVPQLLGFEANLFGSRLVRHATIMPQGDA